MHLGDERVNQITGAVWLIGLGILFATNFWWPGVLFLVGAGALAQGLAEGRGWYALQGSLWAFGLGVAFLLGAHFIAAVLITLGLSMLLGAIVRPPMLKPKPHVYNDLE